MLLSIHLFDSCAKCCKRVMANGTYEMSKTKRATSTLAKSLLVKDALTIKGIGNEVTNYQFIAKSS